MDTTKWPEIRRFMITMKAKVDDLAAEWAEHCRRVWFSSNLSHYLDHAAYRQLVALGPDALPHIMERYQADELPWEFVLQEITGARVIEDPNAYSPAEAKAYWLRWWAEQAQNGDAGSRPQRVAPPG